MQLLHRANYHLTKSFLNAFSHPPDDFYSVPGYLHPVEARLLYWLARKVPAGGLVLEVGSFKGRSANFLAAGLRPGARLACVDTWRNDAMPYDAADDVLNEFVANTAGFRDRIETYRGTSQEVSGGWDRSRLIDLLFIDGDHSYEGSHGDLAAWGPLVRPGGWVAFHDSGCEGVARTIAELFPRSRRGPHLQAGSVLAARKRA